MTPDAYFPYLRSAYLISVDDQELIQAEKTRKAKSQVLLDILMQKGPRCYEGLIRAIQYGSNNTQIFLVENLNKEFEKKKNNMKGLVYLFYVF